MTINQQFIFFYNYVFQANSTQCGNDSNDSDRVKKANRFTSHQSADTTSISYSNGSVATSPDTNQTEDYTHFNSGHLTDYSSNHRPVLRKESSTQSSNDSEEGAEVSSQNYNTSFQKQSTTALGLPAQDTTTSTQQYFSTIPAKLETRSFRKNSYDETLSSKQCSSLPRYDSRPVSPPLGDRNLLPHISKSFQSSSPSVGTVDVTVNV